MPEQEEELLIYRVMGACGVIGAATLLVGGVAFLVLGPRETDAVPGAISSVTAYDASRGVPVGGDRRSFSAEEDLRGCVLRLRE